MWTARLRPGSAGPEPLQDHDELRWLGPGEVWDVPWLDQDVPAVREALAHLGAAEGLVSHAPAAGEAPGA